MKNLLYIIFFITSIAFSQTTLQINNSDSIYQVGYEYVNFIEDKNNDLKIDKILNNKDIKFEKCNLENPAFGINPHTFWLHFKVQNNLTDSLYLRIINPLLKTANLYVTKNDSLISFKKVLALENEVEIPYSAFHIPINQNEVYELYLECNADVPVIVPIRIFSIKAISKVTVNHIIPDMLVLGAILMMMFYNLLIGISIRSRAYILYFFYSLSVGLTIFFLRGYGTVILGEYHRIVDDYFPITVSMVTILLNIFAYEFLQIDQYYKKGKWIIYGNIIAQVVTVFIFLLGFKNLNVFIFQLINPITNILVIYIGIILWKKGLRSAKFFVIAFSTYVISVSLMNITFANILPFKSYSIYFLHFGSLFELLLFSIALADKINSYRQEKEIAQKETIELIKNQNVTLERKVEERTIELINANEEINTTLNLVNEQKREIEKNHDDITASISYASRIQKAVLPSMDSFSVYNLESSILFLPKDIVSGDFFWQSIQNQNLILTVADCTGHGVPGAFMSMLGMTFLNEIVNNKEITQPDLILNLLRDNIKNALSQNDQSQSKDGMDISLCNINVETGVLNFSGAYNSLFILRNNEIIELKADRQPVGAHLKETPFTNSEFQLIEGDILYLQSDGYVSQLGGEKIEKLKTSKFKNILLEIYKEPLNIQHEILLNTLKTWQGNTKQTDDITVMILKYK